ncbi:MAG TPA: hypothetical protein VK694_06895 [Verrucomicrobiae bacterium]|nr:hypothetical protein [Verrucomicrobiae bacterium]
MSITTLASIPATYNTPTYYAPAYQPRVDLVSISLTLVFERQSVIRLGYAWIDGYFVAIDLLVVTQYAVVIEKTALLVDGDIVVFIG